MTSGRMLTENDRWLVLKCNHDGMKPCRIAKIAELNRKTVMAIIHAAASELYELRRPRRIDDLQDGPTA